MRIIGDDSSNQIALTQAGGFVTVTPLDGETINGVAGPAVIPVDLLTTVQMRMAGGDDLVQFNASAISGNSVPFMVRNSISGNLGDGNDELILNGVSAGGVRVYGQAGDDNFSLLDADPVGGSGPIPSQIANDFVVIGNNGNDSALIGGSTVGGTALIAMGGGSNSASIFGQNSLDADIAGNLRYIGGSGSDTVVFSGGAVHDGTAVIVHGSVFLNLGTGMADTILADAMSRLTVWNGFWAGSRASEVQILLDSTTINGETVIATGGGNDSITFYGVHSLRNAFVNTGRGFDSVRTMAGANFGFETTNVNQWLRVRSGRDGEINLSDLNATNGLLRAGDVNLLVNVNFVNAPFIREI